MTKPRDYKEENARRPWAKVAKTQQVSYWRTTNYVALQTLVPKAELNALVWSGNMPKGGILKLLEIARIDQQRACDLLAKPDLINATYKNLKGIIDEARPKRISAAARIDRAWGPYFDRWLQKFDPDDWHMVRQECAKRIMEKE